ncbi:hypothetical protein SBX64_01140 [Vibrio rhizosphaerae]|uniref:Uncharacterized protein n=1 Tax=Vibrio rhizosphaerae TaxID=398736 RepID=A0ABU4IP45_9VIBR|nr:hypothetical protein [Vibrio rhizosphaerae]MDW6091181.1 hypothetical protein [Vibrio rhizosphaerae]
MLLTVPYKNIFPFKILKFIYFNVFPDRGSHNITDMNNHLKKDIGLCPEEQDDHHHSKFL